MADKKNKLVDVVDMPQADADDILTDLKALLNKIKPFKVKIGSPAEEKGLLRLSDKETQVSFTLNRAIVDNPTMFGDPFPKDSFQSAQANSIRNEKNQEVLEQIFSVIFTRRKAINHNRKQGLLQGRVVVNQAVESGDSEFDVLKKSIDDCFTKTFTQATTFDIAPFGKDRVSNVDGGTSFYNSGITALNILFGADEGMDWFEVAPKTETPLPNNCKALIVKNLSDTVAGEFRVRLTTPPA